MAYGLTRRAAVLWGAAAALATRTAPAGTTAPAPTELFQDRWSETLAYLKLRARANTGDAWYWFSGTIELLPRGAKGLTLVNVDCLNLRRVRQEGDRKFTITMWEGAVMTDPATGRIADTIVNPLNGRTVQPMHYREGPTEFVADERGFGTTTRQFDFSWTVGGGHVWVDRAQQIDTVNPLSPQDWPLESSGPRLHGASASTLHGLWKDVVDPAEIMPTADMAFTSSTDWFPWMLMGQTAGSVLYRARGPRLRRLDDAPARVRQLVEGKHPELFRPIPWTEKSLGVIGDHARLRRPVRP